MKEVSFNMDIFGAEVKRAEDRLRTYFIDSSDYWDYIPAVVEWCVGRDIEPSDVEPSDVLEYRQIVDNLLLS